MSTRALRIFNAIGAMSAVVGVVGLGYPLLQVAIPCGMLTSIFFHFFEELITAVRWS